MPPVRRVLLVLRGVIDADTVKRRCAEVAYEPLDLAVCYELPSGHDSFDDALSAQRALTELLREACGARAESVPIFTVSDRDGDRVDDYAREWGATEVCA